MKSTDLNEFLSTPGIIVDVRSPAEYIQGRIPGAVNIPLFNNEERAKIGTIYKQVGKEEAISLGLKIVGPKLLDLVEQAKALRHHGTLKIHCWRGGMRSAFLANLLDTIGFSTQTLSGGYKSFRRWALTTLNRIEEKKPIFFSIGGYTGCGKTEILHLLATQGAQVIDLEDIASHRGSSFGIIGMPPQPSNEQFENELAKKLSKCDFSKAIWVEDESRQIGTCSIPNQLFQCLLRAPLYLIQTPLELRLNRLVSGYGNSSQNDLISAVLRISRRFGGLRTKKTIELIQERKFREAFKEILTYYDSSYQYSIDRTKRPIHVFEEASHAPNEWVNILMEKTHEA